MSKSNIKSRALKNHKKLPKNLFYVIQDFWCIDIIVPWRFELCKWKTCFRLYKTGCFNVIRFFFFDKFNFMFWAKYGIIIKFQTRKILLVIIFFINWSPRPKLYLLITLIIIFKAKYVGFFFGNFSYLIVFVLEIRLKSVLYKSNNSVRLYRDRPRTFSQGWIGCNFKNYWRDSFVHRTNFFMTVIYLLYRQNRHSHRNCTTKI